ncbi:dipeptidase [Ralstonia solanacearum]|uniref:dipeptidase n=1 Tax=Ralstonia solanacearum TaxID=305 RepID=UPI00044B9B5C|nr:dipeptidase [Ralstonia solanacearum]EUJ14572.1 beta-Ala-Xaa dipeptidase PepV [Ralstonia solanacearum P673]MCL9846210.1 dipeptidase [Ralstonia solanacearum]MCL9849134.1 dipeptidase [Ralstonia solanacearum]MCL9853615.1 dipeptidase [Ralstonia solanacearum]MCL9858774.1 dipeptidase [Ralstonia solanacearum]
MLRLACSGLSALTFVLSLSVAAGVGAAALKKPELDALVSAGQSGAVPSDLSGFLEAAAKADPQVAGSVAAYRNRSPLVGDDLVNIGRLLGLYNRLHNQQAAIASIEAMVALPTVRDDKIPQREHPAIVAFGKLVEGMARDFGLRYRNVDNRVFEVTLPGTGADEFGILTHADVVPARAEEWVLDDGTRLDPFKVTRVGDLLYGRGTIDDKGSIAAALYAMKTIKDSGVPIARTIRLMIETTEESGGDGMKYYRERTQLPAYNVVLDSKYPAVVAEKGSGALKVAFPAQAVEANRLAIVAMTGAASANAVPQTATATLRGGDLGVAAAALEARRDAFVRGLAAQGAFSIDVTRSADSIVVKVTGTSAHGSRPEEGVNPLPRLALFLRAADLDLADNAYAHAVRYLTDLYGTDYLGNPMGVAYQDDFMGPLTLSPNVIGDKNGRVEVTVNVRMPRGKTPEALRSEIADKINAWANASRIAVEIRHDQGNWMARDPKGTWLATLLNIYGETTGLDARPVPTAGGTTAKLMPNAVNFGPAMPGKKYTAHNAKEYKAVPDLDLDMQMFTEMLVRIGNLPSMQ